MDMKRVTTSGESSSNIYSIGYDPETKTLGVCFLDKDKKSAGALYHITPKEADDDSLAFHHAEMSKDEISTGSYYHSHIRNGEYVITKQ